MSLVPPRYTSIPHGNVKTVAAVASEAVGVWQLEGRLPWALWVRPRKAAKGRGYVPSFTAGSAWGREQAAQSCFTAAFRAGPDFSAHTQSGKVIDNSMNFWGEFVPFYSVVH